MLISAISAEKIHRINESGVFLDEDTMTAEVFLRKLSSNFGRNTYIFIATRKLGLKSTLTTGHILSTILMGCIQIT